MALLVTYPGSLGIAIVIVIVIVIKTEIDHTAEIILNRQVEPRNEASSEGLPRPSLGSFPERKKREIRITVNPSPHGPA